VERSGGGGGLEGEEEKSRVPGVRGKGDAVGGGLNGKPCRFQGGACVNGSVERTKGS